MYRISLFLVFLLVFNFSSHCFALKTTVNQNKRTNVVSKFKKSEQINAKEDFDTKSDKNEKLNTEKKIGKRFYGQGVITDDCKEEKRNFFF